MLCTELSHSYIGNLCSIQVPHPLAKEKQSTAATEEGANAQEGNALHVDRIRNCDIFVDKNDLYFYADVKLYKFHSRVPFDLKKLTTLQLTYDTSENCYQLQLHCLQPTASAANDSTTCDGGGGSTSTSVGSSNGVVAKPKTVRPKYITTCVHVPKLSKLLPGKEPVVHEHKLRRITEECQLKLTGDERIYNLTNNFGYGYASKYTGIPRAYEMDHSTCHILDPHTMSPILRRIERLQEEMKRFSREQYKLNFVELQVPPGHQNPLRYKTKIHETSMTHEQAHLLHILCCYAEESMPPSSLIQNEIDCGLISIVLAICYDVRTTNNEPTCESGWTRSILSPLFCYYEQFTNYKDVVIAFLRRVITYPLYRNFELGRLCVNDTIEVLKSGRNWLINQMLLTHQQFATGEPNRDKYNVYYLRDYIRYITNATICSDEHLRLVARNVKNVLIDVNKWHLGLGVAEIETELIKELMQEMRVDGGTESPSSHQNPVVDDDVIEIDNESWGQEDEATTDDDSVVTDSFDSMDMRLIENGVSYAVEEIYDDDDDDDENDVDDEDQDDEDDVETNSSTTTTSEAEGNSVIEQCSNSNSEAALSNSEAVTNSGNAK